MEIYIEVIILDNLIIDYIILRLCGMKERRSGRWWRLLLASGLGVLVAFVSLASLGDWLMLGIKIAASAGMVFVAFGGVKFLKMLFDFYFFTFAIGGVAMGVLYMKEGISFGVFGAISSVPTGVIFGAVFAGYIIAKRVIYIFSGDGVKSSYTYVVEIANNDMSRLISGFLDTGNLLTFGSDMRGVCICEYRKMASVFKGQKPRGQVMLQTAAGENLLNVYRVEVMKIYEIVGDGSGGCDACGKLVSRVENVAVALSKAAMFEDFDILLSPRLFY